MPILRSVMRNGSAVLIIAGILGLGSLAGAATDKKPATAKPAAPAKPAPAARPAGNPGAGAVLGLPPIAQLPMTLLPTARQRAALH
jgi:hypothetical protein